MEQGTILPPKSPCASCPLRKRPKVWGEGKTDSQVCVVGQSPGTQEVKLKRPFVGRAGVRMDKVFADLGLPRPDVWLTNVVKCFIPAKAEVPPEAVTCCAPYLEKELANRRIVITIGKVADDAVKARYSGRFIIRTIVHPAATLYRAKYEAVLLAQCEHLRREVDEWRQAGLL